MKKKLSQKKIFEEIKRNKKEIKKFHVKRIGLFGSFIKKKQTKRSDVDFLVEFNKVSFDNYMNLLILLKELFNRKIDLVIERDLRPELEYVKSEVQYVKL